MKSLFDCASTLRACMMSQDKEVSQARSDIIVLKKRVRKLEDDLLDAEIKLGESVKKYKEYKQRYEEASRREQDENELNRNLLRNEDFMGEFRPMDEYCVHTFGTEVIGYIPVYEDTNSGPIREMNYSSLNYDGTICWCVLGGVVEPSMWMTKEDYDRYAKYV